MKKLYYFNRLENIIKNKIYILLYKKINDTRINNFIITKINISKDISIIKIFVIFYKNYNIAYKIFLLNKSSNFFRKNIFKSLKIKFMPMILFKYDYEILKKRNLLNIINKINI